MQKSLTELFRDTTPLRCEVICDIIDIRRGVGRMGDRPYIGGNTGSSKWRAKRKEIMVKRGPKCEGCQRKIRPGKNRFVLHHIDGDPANNEGDNLALLCYLCQARIHALSSFWDYYRQGMPRPLVSLVERLERNGALRARYG